MNSTFIWGGKFMFGHVPIKFEYSYIRSPEKLIFPVYDLYINTIDVGKGERKILSMAQIINDLDPRFAKELIGEVRAYYMERLEKKDEKESENR